ncbi:hypothetical protein [Bradyrhizobium sp. CCBAU 11361]|uniref:hypothetical protein n=1 Tax=Bradyrhizobium sp. CCBAU 11361 TaxID=1630812 RepID=UPI0023025981|nr:hypothetical protein [Bradyrhizobium sp. CCBAU 11361]
MFSSFCLADDTLAQIAAVFIFASRYIGVDAREAHLIWNENFVNLFKFDGDEAIERKF